MRVKILGHAFFNRPTLQVAEDLLGKFLVVRPRSPQVRRGKTVAYVITEVEAYDGFHDKASHASRGKTKRNAPMFGSAGHWYVYFTYGMHWMLNIVTRERGYPAAVLIRGACPVRSPLQRSGIPLGGITSNGVKGISGPARLTKKLAIDKRFNGLPASKKTGLWIEDRGVRIPTRRITRGNPSTRGLAQGDSPRRRIKKSPRVGVAYADRMWAKKPWRFYLAD